MKSIGLLDDMHPAKHATRTIGGQMQPTTVETRNRVHERKKLTPTCLTTPFSKQPNCQKCNGGKQTNVVFKPCGVCATRIHQHWF